MPALALVKAGILMPSHSLRLCWCNSDRGHKGSARSRVQLRPKAAAKPESWADFSRTLGGFLHLNFRKRWRIFSEHLADFPVNGADFWAKKIRIAGRILPVRSAEILRRNFLC